MISKLKNGLKILFNPLAWLSLVLCFGISLLVLNFSLQRSLMVKVLKAEILTLQSNLNEFGYDLAYDNLKINGRFPLPVLKVENLQIYPLTSNGTFGLQIPHLELHAHFWQPYKFDIKIADQQAMMVNNQTYNYKLGPSDLSFELNDLGDFNKIKLNFSELDIKDFAKINILTYNGQTNSANSFENQLDVQDITLNGLLDYPLAQKINRLYLHANLSGKIQQQDNFRRSLNDWLQQSGNLNIESLVINWPPFALVGRGELSFNEELTPRLHLETSSKAMINFMDELDAKNWLESKGVFVAKVLLTNKSYLLKETDKYLTVTTPIDYRDNRLAIEKITVKTFNP